MQTEIDFTVMMPEHNRNGQDESYQSNKEHFKGQTGIVWGYLIEGKDVTSEEMYLKHRIIDTRARIYAIRKSLVGTSHRIVESKIPGANGAKKWSLELIKQES